MNLLQKLLLHSKQDYAIVVFDTFLLSGSFHAIKSHDNKENTAMSEVKPGLNFPFHCACLFFMDNIGALIVSIQQIFLIHCWQARTTSGGPVYL
jgi:hypothetical protein